MSDDFLAEFSLAMRSKGPSCTMTHLLLQRLRFSVRGAAALGTFLATNAMLQVRVGFLLSIIASPRHLRWLNSNCRRSTSRTANWAILPVGVCCAVLSSTTKFKEST